MRDDIFKAVAEIERMVNKWSLGSRVRGDHWLEKLGKKRDEDGLSAHMVKGVKGEGILFTSKVMKENKGSSRFPARVEGSSL